MTFERPPIYSASDFAETLGSWFAANRRDLPWRRDYEPYRVWLSEVMLQQTQMERGVAYFERFTARFPTLADLAGADEEEVLKLWEGLGYYYRARNLLRAARAMAADGGFPSTVEGLRALPGVGPYTAAAVASIAFNRPEPLADANVERLFARVLDLDRPVKERETRAAILEAAGELLGLAEPRVLNQALMEFGALVCTPRAPRCAACPAAAMCEANRLGIVHERPLPQKARDIVPLAVATGVLAQDGRVFVQKRPEKGVWGGLWEFPGGCVEPGEAPEDAVVREFDEETGFAVRVVDKLALIRHGYTTYRVSLHCFLLEPAAPLADPVLTAATACRFATLEELSGLAFPAGHRKLLDRLPADPRLAGTPPAAP